MNDAYFCWLVGLIGNRYICDNYQKLLHKLYVTEYIWELDYDRNRAEDGLCLRRMFIKNTGYMTPYNEFINDNNRPCSVLEMMVALAKKAENDIMYDPDYGDRSGLWMWTMMQNLGLDIYDDRNWYEPEVDKILDIFMHHRYAMNGTGGAFPIHTKTRDLRKTDLWWQMNAYLEEHYPM